jgi:hypothetical protein
MTYRQIKKYIKSILTWWEYIDIFEREYKKELIKQCKRFKSKRQLKKYFENE